MSRIPITWGLVLARAGSKGIPRKNLVSLRGVPLVLLAVHQALRVSTIDRVLVSTDDDDVVTLVSGEAVEVVYRPSELATDGARSASAAVHALDAAGAHEEDVVVLLQPTSPLRSDEDVERTIAGLGGTGCCITVQEVEHHPLKTLLERGSGFESPRGLADLETPRQELPRAVAPNGAVYVIRVADLRSRDSFFSHPIRTVMMPRDRSLDVDSPEDIVRAEILMEARETAWECREG
jgi:N-acylneuraminate cytidylyltransferase